jgi:peptidoglycan/xylan/chitin deacetylase (PgdA/CDA1 family)
MKMVKVKDFRILSMINTSLITSIVQRPVNITYRKVQWKLKRLKTRSLKTYADWRVGATKAEKYSYRNADTVMLSFDDYGSEAQVDELLTILNRESLKAMFFLQGDWAIKNPAMVAKVAAAGHVIGNHTYSHPDLLSLTDEEVRQEISTGVASSWLRPPRGRYNARIRRIAADLGYRICYWTIDSDDWQGVPGDVITRKVLAEVHPGAVILFHIHADETRRVLPSLISAIREKGYQLASLNDPKDGPLL